MKGVWQRLLKQYGQTLRLSPEGEPFQAFLQPITSNSGELPLEATPLGAADERRWLYLGSPEREIRMGDLLEGNGLRFEVINACCVYLGEQPLYYRGVLKPYGEVEV